MNCLAAAAIFNVRLRAFADALEGIARLIAFPGGAQGWLTTGYTNMRKGFDGLLCWCRRRSVAKQYAMLYPLPPLWGARKCRSLRERASD